MTNISSFSNPRFKYLKSLSKSRNRKKEEVFIMEGREELDLALKSGLQPRIVVFTESYVSVDYISDTYGSSRIEIIQITKPLFDDLAYQKVPKNYIAVFDAWTFDLNEIATKEKLVVLEGLEKPGNLGAILRTCSAAGINNVIVTESDIDLFNPNVIRNSRGALFNVNVIFTSNKELLGFLRTNDYTILATSIEGSSKNYRSVIYDGNKAIVFGSESKGITSFWLENSEERIMIPMSGNQDSLNLSVSVGVILFSTHQYQSR